MEPNRLALLALAIGSNLPVGMVSGVLMAKLASDGLSNETLGLLSLSSLGYAFKYLWSPLIEHPQVKANQKSNLRTRQLCLIQTAISLLLLVLALVGPDTSVIVIYTISLLVLLLSPTYDVILDGLRVEAAKSLTQVNSYAAHYQSGFQFGGFLSGFVALTIAAQIGWRAAFLTGAIFMALTVAGSLLFQPSTQAAPLKKPPQMKQFTATILPIAACLLLAASVLSIFLLARCFQLTEHWDGTSVSVCIGILAVLTLGIPSYAAISGIRSRGTDGDRLQNQTVSTPPKKRRSMLLRNPLTIPISDLAIRLKWKLIIIVCIAVTYRIGDSTWSSFAYPFYIKSDQGALGYSIQDVAIASKLFGVLASLAGTLVGAWIVRKYGVRTTLTIGCLLAAATNILFIDLANGDGWIAWVSQNLQDNDLVNSNIDHELETLKLGEFVFVVFCENLAAGIATLALIVFVSSIVNPDHGAVQFAIIASLGMLVSVVMRPWIGLFIDINGFIELMRLSTWLGLVPLVFCGLYHCLDSVEMPTPVHSEQ